MPEVVGKYNVCETNERGLRLLQFCSLNKYVLTNTITNINLIEDLQGYLQMENQKAFILMTDVIITSQDDKKIFKNSRYQSADIGSDNSLVMANVQLSGKFRKRPKMKGKQYDVAKLTNDQNLADTFKVTIVGAFAPLMAFEDQDINQLYEQLQKLNQQNNRKYRWYKEKSKSRRSRKRS